MNWLITGGCGFIGRALAGAVLAEEGRSVRILDNLSVGSRADLAEVGAFTDITNSVSSDQWQVDLTLLEGDILDREAVRQAVEGADTVVHLAANTGVAPSVADPEFDCRTNVLGTLNLLQSCAAASVQRLVFASSGAPLGAQEPPLHEEMAPHPASPYGASKLAGEAYCSAFHHCFGLQTVILRFGNVYGEGSGHKQSVVAKFIRQALSGNPLEIYGDGRQTRDFIHIADLVDAVRRAAVVSGVEGETFQIATARETTVGELTDMLAGVMQAEGFNAPEVFHGETRAGDVKRNYSDTSKAFDMLGWRARVPLEEGLRRTVRYFFEKHTD